MSGGCFCRGALAFAAALATWVLGGRAQPAPGPRPAPIPNYLSGYEALYAVSPRRAALRWLVDAKYGLMVHYCLASVLNQGKSGYLALPYVIKGLEPPAAGELGDGGPDDAARQAADRYLFERFTASAFAADKIADLAVAAGMKYVTFTTQHLGGMFLWNTALSDFNSVRSPARRDLVAEMASACRRRGLGLFLYVPPDASRTDGDFLRENRLRLRELLGHYGPIAGIWFDGIGPFHQHPERYRRVQELFSLVRTLQPQCLVSWKGYPIGTDFSAPEHTVGDFGYKHPELPVEVCTTMQECSRRDLIGHEAGWINNEATPHLSADAVIMMIRELQLEGASDVLINIGLRGDGSIHPADEAALRAVGAYMRRNWSARAPAGAAGGQVN